MSLQGPFPVTDRRSGGFAFSGFLVVVVFDLVGAFFFGFSLNTVPRSLAASGQATACHAALRAIDPGALVGMLHLLHGRVGFGSSEVDGARQIGRLAQRDARRGAHRFDHVGRDPGVERCVVWRGPEEQPMRLQITADGGIMAVRAQPDLALGAAR